MFNKIFHALFLLTAFTVFNANAVTIFDEEAMQKDTAANDGERTLHGNFNELNQQRLLTTSVGNYQLDASTRVTDRRLDPNAETKVTIRFREDRISHVTIYQ